jgi:hypothetical protein
MKASDMKSRPRGLPAKRQRSRKSLRERAKRHVRCPLRSGALFRARLNSLRKNSLYEGHGFSRAAKDHGRDAALAAEVRFWGH